MSVVEIHSFVSASSMNPQVRQMAFLSDGSLIRLKHTENVAVPGLRLKMIELALAEGWSLASCTSGVRTVDAALCELIFTHPQPNKMMSIISDRAKQFKEDTVQLVQLNKELFYSHNEFAGKPFEAQLEWLASQERKQFQGSSQEAQDRDKKAARKAEKGEKAEKTDKKH